MLRFSKRQRFVIATLVLVAGIILSRMGLGVFLQWRLRVPLFFLGSILVTIWALRDEDFRGLEWFVLPVLPVFFALGALLVLPLLPERMDFLLWLAPGSDTGLILGLLVRLAFLAIFVIGYYAALLSANIFNVAAVRSIQLLRVAHSIGFLLSVATALLLFVVIASLHLPSFANFLAVFVVTAFLAFPAIWSVNLAEKVGELERNYALATAAVLAEVAWALSFWPVGVSVFAIFLTALFYELVGIIQEKLSEKLNRNVANEFVIVAIVVFLLTIFTTRWGS